MPKRDPDEPVCEGCGAQPAPYMTEDDVNLCKRCWDGLGEDEVARGATPAAERNQCDGCCAGMPLENGIHLRPTGLPVMVCTADRYRGATPTEGA